MPSRLGAAILRPSPVASLSAPVPDRAFTLSQAGNRVRRTSNHDRFPSFAYCSYHGENAKGDQRPILNVFVRTPDGSIRQGYATELMFPPRDPGQGQDSRHVASVWPMGACSISRPRARGADTHSEAELRLKQCVG